MAFRENFKGVQAESGEFSNIPENIYFVIVEKAKETQTKTSGNNMVNVGFRITQGEYKNSAIWDHIVFHEKMKGRNKHILKVLNQPYEGEPIIEPANWIDQELRVRVRVKWDDYRKGFVSKITQYLYLEEKEPEKEVKETKEKIEKTFGKEEEPPLQKEAPGEGEKEEDEIPF